MVACLARAGVDALASLPDSGMGSSGWPARRQPEVRQFGEHWLEVMWQLGRGTSLKFCLAWGLAVHEL